MQEDMHLIATLGWRSSADSSHHKGLPNYGVLQWELLAQFTLQSPQGYESLSVNQSDTPCDGARAPFCLSDAVHIVESSQALLSASSTIERELRHQLMPVDGS